MRRYGPFTVTLGTPITNSLPGTQAAASALMFFNMSQFTLWGNIGGQSFVIPPESPRLLEISGDLQWDGNLDLTPKMDLLSPGSPSSNTLYVEVYGAGEKLPQSVPVAMTRTIGGVVGTSQTSTLVNEGSGVGSTACYSTSRLQGTTTPGLAMTVDGSRTLSSQNGGLPSLIIEQIQAGSASTQYSETYGNINAPSQTQVYGRQSADQGDILLSGNQETGGAGLQGFSAGAGVVYGYFVRFRQVMTNIPSSISFNPTGGSSNITSVTAAAITKDGFFAQFTITAGGSFFWIGTFTMSGN